MQTANHEAVARSIKAALPAWVPHDGLKVSDNLSKLYRVGFRCPCHGKVWVGVKIPVGGATPTEMVSKLVAAVEKQHGVCAEQITAYPKPVEQEQAETIGTLRNQAVRSIATKRKMQTDLELAHAKLRKADIAVSGQSEQKRQDSRAESRRVELDKAVKDKFNDADKSTALLSKCSGLVDTLKYWCQGSEHKLLQLVMSQIRHFNLEDKVAGELDAQCSTRDAKTNRTNRYIVSRARSALQTLKQCTSEQQRQEYRVVLTALAPEKGRAKSVAAALGVSRDKKPMVDAIKKRSEIEIAVKASTKPLKVGDTVVCRHGTGTLVEYSEDEQQPCAVQIRVGAEYTHTSKFKESGKDKGGARLRRVPITFGHSGRDTRYDAVSADVVQKVSVYLQCSFNIVAVLFQYTCSALSI